MNQRSKLVRMRIVNLGCVGPEGIIVDLDNIVCLVGANNSGKSTVLRAYEAAVSMSELRFEDINSQANGEPTTVELWVHIPVNAENIDAKWKEKSADLLLVRSKWEWQATGGKPNRTTWDPETQQYAQDGKASGLDNVFNSRLPKPFRIGSLDDPADEHKKLLELVLEPIKSRLAKLMSEDTSDLRIKIKALQEEAGKPVSDFTKNLELIQKKVSSSYQRVFSSAEVRLSVSLGELAIDPGSALVKSSRVEVIESHGPTRWSQQGTGSQRALFWSMLEVRSELNRLADSRKAMEKAIRDKQKELDKKQIEAINAKTENTRSKKNAEADAISKEIEALKEKISGEIVEDHQSFLPGFMLLIDEPETALHPNAIRAAKEHLYSLAEESGWQVMLSTHHPAFLDPLKDHTTIVRLHRPDYKTPPNIYRTDEIVFSTEEKNNLKALLAFDSTVAEMFFGSKVIVVEGDTEFAAFTEIINGDLTSFSIDSRPLLIRARGKATIPTLIKMLTHFKVDFAVLHDIDPPRTANGGRKNSAYTVNHSIAQAITDARTIGINVIHRCSCPNFEQHHGLELPEKDKPFTIWKEVRENDKIKQLVLKMLQDLCSTPDADSANHKDDGKNYDATVREWANRNAKDHPAYNFDACSM